MHTYSPGYRTFHPFQAQLNYKKYSASLFTKHSEHLLPGTLGWFEKSGKKEFYLQEASMVIPEVHSQISF